MQYRALPVVGALALAFSACGGAATDSAGSDGGDTTADASATTVEATSNAAGDSDQDQATDTDAETGTLVVWDFKSGDEAFQDYYAAAESGFEAAHPGIDVEFVAQPFDQYYNLVGTAIQSGEGPDLMMFNGGAQILDRTDALLPLDEYVAQDRDRVAGWEKFSDGATAYAVPLTIQGIPIYYNKAVYDTAGLDASNPPTSFAELTSACEAIVASGTSCFTVGNKEGLALEFWLSSMAPGSLTSEEYDAWLAGDRDWNSPNITRIFETWEQSNSAGWNNAGVNSTAMFMDSFETFQRAEAGNVIGLISDVAHWKDFGDFIGDDLGLLPPLSFEGGNDAPFLAAEGGIGYGVTKWTEKPGLSAELALYMTDTALMTIFFESSGAIVSDTSVDLSGLNNEAAKAIVADLPNARPLVHTALTTAGLDALHLVGQQLAAGEITVDEALAAMAEADA